MKNWDITTKLRFVSWLFEGIPMVLESRWWHFCRNGEP